MPTFRVLRPPTHPAPSALRLEGLSEPLAETIRAANDAYIGALLGEHALPSGTQTLPPSLLQALGSLNRAQRRRICALPFTLFSLRFADASFWRDLIEQPADAVRRSGAAESFCRTAVFLAWHLVQAGPTSAGMALGMSGEVVALYQWLPLSDLDRLATLAQSAIAPRWPAHSGFWRRLIDAARCSSSIDSARYFGLHLLAGECLPPEQPRLRA